MPGFWRMWAASLRVTMFLSVYVVSILIGVAFLPLQVFKVVNHLGGGQHTVEDLQRADELADVVLGRVAPRDPGVRYTAGMEGQVILIERDKDPSLGGGERQLVRVGQPAS